VRTTRACAPSLISRIGGWYSSADDELEDVLEAGTPIAAGKTVTIEATVWATGSTNDFLDLYHTSTPSSPSWTLIGTLSPGGSGARTIAKTFTLPPGTQHAIRGQFRFYFGTPSVQPCYAYGYNDRDDLVFAASAP
jgi:leucyl aminopeptidase